MKLRNKHSLTKFQRKKLIRKASFLLDQAEYHIDQIILAAHRSQKINGK